VYDMPDCGYFVLPPSRNAKQEVAIDAVGACAPQIMGIPN